MRGTDPIEKKTLFHFHPGSGAYSIATVGCNFRCKNCQNFNISRFHPSYKLTHLPPTPVTTLREAREIGLEVGLRYVYEGNVPGEDGESTYCYQCGELLIRHYGFQIMTNKISDSKCPHCGAMIDGVL